jgi:hypothetical protein
VVAGGGVVVVGVAVADPVEETVEVALLGLDDGLLLLTDGWSFIQVDPGLVESLG